MAICWERGVRVLFAFCFCRYTGMPSALKIITSGVRYCSCCSYFMRLNCICCFPIWCLGQDVEFGYIGSWSLPFHLLYFKVVTPLCWIVLSDPFSSWLFLVIVIIIRLKSCLFLLYVYIYRHCLPNSLHLLSKYFTLATENIQSDFPVFQNFMMSTCRLYLCQIF